MDMITQNKLYKHKLEVLFCLVFSYIRNNIAFFEDTDASLAYLIREVLRCM